MPLSLAEVEHIAELAKLNLMPEEKETYREQLSAILDYAARLQEIDTADIPPTASVLPLRTVLREDVSRPGLPREELLANVKHKDKGQFRVDAVLDESA